MRSKTIFSQTEKKSAWRQRARGQNTARGGRPHLDVAAGTPAGRAFGDEWARACAASSPSPWPPASPSCRTRPCGEPSGSQGRPGQARLGLAAVARGGAVPGELVPSDVVHEAVAHVQPPARLAAEPGPGTRRRFHLEPLCAEPRPPPPPPPPPPQLPQLPPSCPESSAPLLTRLSTSRPDAGREMASRAECPSARSSRSGRGGAGRGGAGGNGACATSIPGRGFSFVVTLSVGNQDLGLVLLHQKIQKNTKHPSQHSAFGVAPSRPFSCAWML